MPPSARYYSDELVAFCKGLYARDLYLYERMRFLGFVFPDKSILDENTTPSLNLHLPPSVTEFVWENNQCEMRNFSIFVSCILTEPDLFSQLRLILRRWSRIRTARISTFTWMILGGMTLIRTMNFSPRMVRTIIVFDKVRSIYFDFFNIFYFYGMFLNLLQWLSCLEWIFVSLIKIKYSVKRIIYNRTWIRRLSYLQISLSRLFRISFTPC